jgi:hypothetical protein
VNCVALTPVLTNAKHTVIIQKDIADDPNASITLDYFQVINYAIFKPSTTIYPETSTAFLYSANFAPPTSDWTNLAYAKFNGGLGKITQVPNATIDFYFEGTGFIFYGDQNTNRGYWDVTIDGIAVNNATSDLSQDSNGGPQQPLALGVFLGSNTLQPTTIGSGVHHVHMVAHLTGVQKVTFDGIRVFQ